jgi:septum formation topological specificity factor MinE
MIFDFLKLKKGLDSVADAIKDLQRTVEAKRAEYERLSSLPASREEVLEALCAYIDVEAKRFPQNLAAQVKNRVIDAADFQRLRGGDQHLGIVLARQHAEIAPTINDIQTSLLYLLASPIKAALAQAVAEMPWAEETAPPRAERERQLEKLDREIATLEKQEKELLEQAAGLGIRV